MRTFLVHRNDVMDIFDWLSTTFPVEDAYDLQAASWYIEGSVLRDRIAEYLTRTPDIIVVALDLKDYETIAMFKLAFAQKIVMERPW
jgi:hypothetical protein